MRRIKHFFFLLCLLVAGAQSAWAKDGYTFYRSCTFQNFTFLLYTYSGDITSYPDLAVLAGINGTDENVTVPNYIEDGGTKYYVECGSDTISNNYVKTLTFQRSYNFSKVVSSTINSDYVGHHFDSYLSCPQLTKIVFEGSVSGMNWDWMGTGTAPHLLCENLTDIFFMGYAPTLSGNWSDYSTAPASNITAHVAEWTAEQCQDKHAHANVWNEFAAVVPCSGISETVTVTASVSAGGAFQISGESALTNGSQTYEAEKYSGLTFFAYPSSTDYLVAHVYVNGTDVISQMTTQSDGKLKYTIANLQDDVTISVVGEEAHVTVTASVSGGGRFQKSGGQELTYGSQEYEVDTHSTFTFLASADGGCQVAHVYLNGRDIIEEMEQLSNGKLRYTIEDIRDDVYISVVGESLYEDAWVSVSPGGKVTYTKNNVPTNITSSAYVRIDNGSTQDLFIIPNEGYELDKYWIGNPYPMQDFTETTGLLALEPQEDGSYKLTIDHGFNILFTFKKTGITDGTVTVSASVSGGGRFQKSGGQELTYGSQEYVVDGHSDFTFTVSAGNSSQVAHVYLNGKDIIEEMEQQANGKLKYTIEDICDNVYISVVGDSTIQTAYITTTPGGKVTYTKNDVPKEIATWDYVEFPVDSSLDLFIVPDEGYELEKYWIEGPPIQDFTETTGMLALVPQDDGSYKLTIDHGFSLLFTFKAKDLITFQDDAVRAICVAAGWDTDGDEQISKAEAAAVESLNANGSSSSVFYNNTDITSFTELQYFTGLTTLKSAFYGCSALEEVIVPYGVTNLNSAFGECLALKKVVIPETVTNIERAFGLVINSENISSLEHMTLPSGLETIGQYAFVKSGLKSIDIPENVTTIGNFAFHSCVNLKMLYIPSAVTSIAGFNDLGNSLSFHNCTGLEAIVVDAQNSNYKSPDGCNAIIEKSSNKLILGCRNTMIPDGVVTLGGYSFFKQPITSVVIPASVSAIEAYCFNNCADLAMVECKRETPPSIAGTSFRGINGDAVLKVPYGCAEAYSSWAQYFGGGIVEAENAVTPVFEYRKEIILAADFPSVRMHTTFNNNGADGIDEITSRHYLSMLPSKYTYQLQVPKDLESFRPVIVMKNGEDVTYDLLEDIDDNYYYYGMQSAANETWEISYDTRHRQAFVVKGGTALSTGVVGNWNYELIWDDDFAYFVPNGVLTFDLPSYDSNKNTYMSLEFSLRPNETFKAIRNGVDVTDLFSSRTGGNTNNPLVIYTLAEVNGGDTQAAYGFQMRDPAVWEITIDDGSGKFDVNSDGEINVSDVTSLVNKILHP